MNCPTCGVDLAADAKECHLCGSPTAAADPDTAGSPMGQAAPPAGAGHERPARPQRRRSIGLLAAALILGGLAVLTGWLLGARQADESQAVGEDVATTAAAPTTPQPTPAMPPGRTPDPPPAAYLTGDWILVLESLSVDQHSLQEAEFLATSPGLTVVDSSAVPGLRAGYWTVVSQKIYPSERAARQDCSSFGRTPSGACYPRQIGG